MNADAKSMAAFEARVKEYADLHRKIEGELPRLSNEATPVDIDRNQREFAIRLAKARADARQGDLFTPDMQDVVRRLLLRLFRRSEDRAELRASILDENTTPVRLKVNGRYPDTVPLSTMPPEVLQNLPPLPEELEYRFVGEALILLDPHAHVVADYVPHALPK